MIAYIDTSAAMKLLADEPEADELRVYCGMPGITIVSTDLLETEMGRAVIRAGIPAEAAADVLDRIDLYELPRAAYAQAGRLPGATLRSLDALHIVGALRIGADEVLTYDTRMSTAATNLGLSVVAPGTVSPRSA